MKAPDATLKAVRAVLEKAFGPDLDGGPRGELVSRTFLASIRDVVLAYLPGATEPYAACEHCPDLRNRLRNIYHLTLTYRDTDPAATLRDIREASGPGAPAPAHEYSGSETRHGRCGVDCLTCAAGAPP